MKKEARRARHLAAVGLTAALAAAPLAPADASTNDDSLGAAYAAAAKQYDVPRDLLVAMGWSETRLDGHHGRPSQANGFGIMHLVSHPGQHTLERAAGLTGLSKAQLRRDDTANIRGAAAVVDALAEDRGLSRADRDDLSSWLPLLEDYAGTKGTVTRSYVEGVADVLEEGLRTNVGTERITVRRHDVDESAALRELPRTKAADVDQPGALWAPASTSNYRAGRTATIDQVVIHVTQGSYAGSISWFQNPAAEVSAHYVIRSSDGQVTQTVREADTAWHAGSTNSRSVGIEHEGYVDDASWFTESLYRSSAEVVKGIASRHGIPLDRQHVIGHSEAPGATHTDPGPNWDWDHYMALVNG